MSNVTTINPRDIKIGNPYTGVRAEPAKGRAYQEGAHTVVPLDKRFYPEVKLYLGEGSQREKLAPAAVMEPVIVTGEPISSDENVAPSFIDGKIFINIDAVEQVNHLRAAQKRDRKDIQSSVLSGGTSVNAFEAGLIRDNALYAKAAQMLEYQHGLNRPADKVQAQIKLKELVQESAKHGFNPHKFKDGDKTTYGQLPKYVASRIAGAVKTYLEVVHADAGDIPVKPEANYLDLLPPIPVPVSLGEG